ncbi:uncharacterized protein LOC128362797 [Scomber japonicus]|uniref:uncharacterized protein LOC128362797 n=1 Tax=Scomber japonicus TaxID=13676 RepID=UPI002306049D|nr:uncharacterized protein LOC128362797 [Scomber japonicus]
MITGLAAFILLSTASLIQTAEIPQQISLTVAELGDNLTLTCPIFEEEAGLFYWYKLSFGHMFQTIAMGHFGKIPIKKTFNNSRFNTAGNKTHYFLNIRNVSKEDEATYFCQAGSAYVMKFIDGTLLTVKDHREKQKSFYVKQTPETESVPPGKPMTLQCSLLFNKEENRAQCPNQRNVYWFKAESQDSHLGVIYTEKTRCDEQEERSCVYSLSKTLLDSSDTGTYYCAVITCGQILFGEGTKVEIVEIGKEWDPVPLVLGALLALCIIVIAVLIFSRDRG